MPVDSQEELKKAHHNWIEDELAKSQLIRDSKWTQSIAVGDKTFVKEIKKRLGIRSKGRKIFEEENNDYQLRDRQAQYGEEIRNLHHRDIDLNA